MAMDLIAWSEKAAMENIRFRLHIAELLAKASEYTLIMLFAGMSGAMAYVLQHIDTLHWPVVGAAVLTLWLMFLSGMLVVQCMMSRNLPVPANCPKNLYQPAYELSALREVELENIQHSIEDTAERNRYVAGWLNRIRMLAVVSPIVFIVSAGAAFLAGAR